MSVSTIVQDTAEGHKTSDLSLKNAVLTARIPKPVSLPTAADGEVAFSTRPQFWYDSQWNPMASLYDIPETPNIFSTASIYLKEPIVVANDVPDIITAFSEQFAVGLTTSSKSIDITISGYYHITAQAAYSDSNGFYYSDKTSMWIAPQELNSSRFICSSGWGFEVIQALYKVFNTEATVYLEAGEHIGLYYTFHCDTAGLGDVAFFGGGLDVPENLGLSTYLQVTWQGPPPASLQRRFNIETDQPDDVSEATTGWESIH